MTNMVTDYSSVVAFCIILMAVVSGISTDCTTTASLPEQCNCTSEPTEVECIHTNGKILTEFPLTLPNTTIHLEISGHNISTIRDIPYPNLVTLRLQNNHIKTIQPGAFQSLKLLRHLVLSNNNLESINSELFNDLQSLRFLKLDNNNIGTIGKQSFDGRFLRNLTKIDLANNRILEMDYAFLDLGISELNLSSNLVSVVPQVKSTRLESLILDHNRIKTVTFDDVDQYPNLRIMSLHHNMLTDITSTAFSKNPLLEDVHLENNNITAIHMGTFSNHSMLRSIRLSWNKIAILNKSAIPWHSHLQDLRLYGNPWKCVCGMSWLYSNSRDSVVYASNYGSQDYRCASPQQLKGKLIYQLMFSDFQCTKSYPHAKFIMVVSLVGVVAVILLFACFTYAMRRRRMHAQYLRPSASSVYRKVTEPSSVVESTSLAFPDDDSRQLVYSDMNDKIV